MIKFALGVAVGYLFSDLIDEWINGATSTTEPVEEPS